MPVLRKDLKELKNMLQAIRNGFKRLSVREKFLITGGLWVLVLLGSMNTVKQLKQTRQRFAKTQRLVAEHNSWLLKEGDINAGLKNALERMDASKTFRRDRLVGKVDGIARTTQIAFDLSAPKTQNNGIFDIHSVRINFKEARLEELIDFYQKIRKEAPYIGLDAINLVPERMDPALIRAQYTISSFELTQQPNA